MATAPKLKILVDTCVWLDLAKDHRQEPLLNAVKELVGAGMLELILPRIVVDEFAANKVRVMSEGRQSLSASVRRVRDLVHSFGAGRGKSVALRQLGDIEHRLQLSTPLYTVETIESLFAASTILEISDVIKVRAADRAIQRKAPFHRAHNGIADAILVELYGATLNAPRAGRTRFAFVTHNVKDFSRPGGDHRQPHPDIAALFSRTKSRYFIRLSDALRSVSRGHFTDVLLDHEFVEEPRSLTEILQAIDELTDRIWYDRHMQLQQRIEDGRTRLVDKHTDTRRGAYGLEVTRDVWRAAQTAARRKERQYGAGNLGPYTKFDWGMINGKLSALRWVLGDEWDMLDT